MGVKETLGTLYVGCMDDAAAVETTSLMSYSQEYLRNLTDMGSLLGTILGTILNYARDPYVHY